MPLCETGRPIKCGDVVRFEHMETRKNLHSDKVRSAVSHHNEVSGYGQDGDGDEKDNWVLECINNPGDIIKGST